MQSYRQSELGLDNSQSHSANVFRVDDPRSEPRVLHELTLKKDGGRRGERYCYSFCRRKREISAKAVSAKRKLKKNRPSSLA